MQEHLHTTHHSKCMHVYTIKAMGALFLPAATKSAFSTAVQAPREGLSACHD